MDVRSNFAGACFRFLGGLALLTLSVCVCGRAWAEPQMFSLYDFQLEDGTVMPELRIAYDTHGRLSPARDNAIVLLHDAFEDHQAFDALIGPGKTFDTNRFFVIAADAIGGGESSSPGEGQGQDFPRYTVRDMMAAEYGLVTHGLGLSRLRAVVGRSMGAFTALEWAVQHPEMLQAMVLIAPAARSDANFRVVVDAIVSAVALDPAWEGGRYKTNPVEGLRHAGVVYFPWTVSTAYLDQLAAEAVGEQAEAMAKIFALWDANGLVLRLAACRGYDAGASFDSNRDAAMARVTMPVLLLASATDRLIAPGAARELRSVLAHATYIEIPTELGHSAIVSPSGTAEGDFIDRAIRGFLLAPK